jgi:hypothetical protein
MEFVDYMLIVLSVGTILICIAVLGALKDSSRRMMQVVEVIGALRDSVERSDDEDGQEKGAATESGAVDSSVLNSIKKYDKHFSLIASTLSSFQTSSDKGFKRIDQDMVRIESLVTGMRDYLAESNQQVSRLQEGYDYSVLKRVVKPVILVATALEALELRVGDSPEGKEMRALWLDLLDSLEQNGIERLNVNQGDDFSGIRKMAEATSVKEATTDSKKVGTVAEVTRPGYCYVYDYDKRRLVLPAQVKLYEKVEG